MPLKGFYCRPTRGKLQHVPFEDCLEHCAPGGHPPCGLNYSILANIAHSVRDPLGPNEVSVTEVIGCLTKPWLLRTTPEVYARPQGLYWRVRGTWSHLAVSRWPMREAIVEQRFRVPLNGTGWTLSGSMDLLEPIRVRRTTLQEAGVELPARRSPTLFPLNGAAPACECSFCRREVQPAFALRMRWEEPVYATICPDCFAQLKAEGHIIWRLWDYKTTRRVPAKKNGMRIRDQRQCVAYVVLAEQAGLPVRDVQVSYMDMGQVQNMPLPVRIRDIPQMWKEWIVPQAEDLLHALQEDYMPDPGPLWAGAEGDDWECRYCDVAYLCPFRIRGKAKPKRRRKGGA